MLIEPSIVIELLLMGAIAGFSAGLLGIGGGMILVPFLTFIFSRYISDDSLAVKIAIATAMASIVLTSLSSVRAHQRRGQVRFDIVKSMLPGIALGSVLASLGVFALLKGAYLAMIFAFFVGFAGWNMFKKSKIPSAPQKQPSALQYFSGGSIVGFVSGLVGAGGGFFNVPFLTRNGINMHQAVATSAALGFPIALINAIGFIISGHHVENLPPHTWGYVYWPALLILGFTSVLCAPLGAKAAHQLPVATLKRIFSILLFGLAAYMLVTGLKELHLIP